MSEIQVLGNLKPLKFDFSSSLGYTAGHCLQRQTNKQQQDKRNKPKITRRTLATDGSFPHVRVSLILTRFAAHHIHRQPQPRYVRNMSSHGEQSFIPVSNTGLFGLPSIKLSLRKDQMTCFTLHCPVLQQRQPCITMSPILSENVT